MKPNFLEMGGAVVDAQSLKVPRARLIVDAVISGTLDFVRLVECRRRETSSNDVEGEIIVMDLDIERPQLTVNDIRRTERVAVVIQNNDNNYPEVLALRSNFPHVPHLNLGSEEFPRSLCLYDRSWDEVRTRWTAPTFIELIRRWLADTATGTLHRDDQPLEAMLSATSYNLVIPTEVVKASGQATEKLDVDLLRSGENRGTFIARKARSTRREGHPPKFIAAMFVADARQHGVIKHAPRNLSELCDFVKGETFDLLIELRKCVKQWKDDGCLEAIPIIVIAFPLQRQRDSEVEIADIWSFMTMQSVLDIGMHTGVWEKIRERSKWSVAQLLRPDESRRGSDVNVYAVRPHFSFSRASAATASNSEPDLCRTVAVGAGALGSQIIMNLVRGGFGRWTVIDDDELMPHNLARHALPPCFVGTPKALGIGEVIGEYYEENPPARTIVANYLRPGAQKQAIDTAFSEAELILDFAASVPVARNLARHVGSTAKRASLFLNPCGSDLVCLSEDTGRTTSLDSLELQYYRAVIRDERLSGHLKANSRRIRYARSCRDVSFSVPTHLVSLHAAIGAKAVQAASATDEAIIKIWRSDPATCEVTVVDVPVHPVHRTVMGDWTLVVDDWLFHRLSALRAGKLPNETGGVLIGSYDLPSKTVYVVDTVPSPPDSEKWPTLYIRGSEGLLARVSEITELTAAQLEYVGEWHSHPEGCSCMPSNDDFKVFAWMTDRMSAAGLPALMGIVGEGQSRLWFLGRMEKNRGGGATSVKRRRRPKAVSVTAAVPAQARPPRKKRGCG